MPDTLYEQDFYRSTQEQARALRALHKAAAVRQALEAAGIACRYLPAYSPDLEPD